MNIAAIVNLLNKEFGYSIDTRIYEYITVWRDWWEGYHRPFHSYQEIGPEGETIHRKIYTMRMAKKVCEDWASILMNGNTSIEFEDETTSKYMLGDDETGEGGLLNTLNFWDEFSNLIEMSFFSGTGAALLRIENMELDGDKILQSRESHFRLDYLPADHIIPLTVKGKKVIEAAFASDVLNGGESFVYLEMHRLSHGEYIIENRYYRDKDGVLCPADLPGGVQPIIHTGSAIPHFAILRPNAVKNIDYGQGMGISIYADALDQLQSIDLAYNNFSRDFKLGGKKVFYDQTLIRYDMKGRAITPDDIAQQLFMQVGDGQDTQGGNPLTEYNPSLRVQENTDGIQAALDYLSFKVGFGTKHYQFNSGSIVTATQYHGDKQELVQHASKHALSVDAAVKGILRAILYEAKDICGAPVDPETQITVKFDDAYIVDPETQKESDRQDVRDGLLMPWEFRVKWYGESEEEAKTILSEKNKNLENPFGFLERSPDPIQEAQQPSDTQTGDV
ncbi:phage portal protein [[Clostridium] leptum]|nr:phage portal protein [[Clostridium] leptum]